MNRRNFITGLVSALAAPVIVRSTSLMQIRGIVMPPAETAYWMGAEGIFTFTPTDSPFLRLISGRLPGFEDWPNDALVTYWQQHDAQS